MAAILFGSISTLADTSELQRESFNAAFAEHGLDWTWERPEYLGMLETSGGQERIAGYARSRGEEVDAAALHATKSRIFQFRLGSNPLPARPGVVDTIAAAQAAGTKLGLVTTTSAGNVSALLAALAPQVEVSSFDVVVDLAAVDAPKPDPAAYRHALEALGEQPATAVAIEDNVDGLGAALAAGLRCVAFPNANTAGHDFPGAEAVVDALDATEVTRLAGAAR